jgi:hypothetical protein
MPCAAGDRWPPRWPTCGNGVHRWRPQPASRVVQARMAISQLRDPATAHSGRTCWASRCFTHSWDRSSAATETGHRRNCSGGSVTVPLRRCSAAGSARGGGPRVAHGPPAYPRRRSQKETKTLRRTQKPRRSRDSATAVEVLAPTRPTPYPPHARGRRPIPLPRTHALAPVPVPVPPRCPSEAGSRPPMPACRTCGQPRRNRGRKAQRYQRAPPQRCVACAPRSAASGGASSSGTGPDPARRAPSWSKRGRRGSLLAPRQRPSPSPRPYLPPWTALTQRMDRAC